MFPRSVYSMTPKRFDNIATLQPIPAVLMAKPYRLQLSELSLAPLPRGQVGTIVEIYTTQTDPHYLIEFSDRQGRAYESNFQKELPKLIVKRNQVKLIIVDPKTEVIVKWTD